MTKAEQQRIIREARDRKFLALCKTQGLPVPQTEYKFLKDRKFAFDFAWPGWGCHDKICEKRGGIALEVEGGVWTGGRHTSGSGFVRDMEKYNLAALECWRVIRCTPSTLCSAETFAMLKALV